MSSQVRVFLSSTFQDFARERELIHAQVIPTIGEMCRHYGLSFELCDLRWGVTARDVNHNRTVQICLDEVDFCRAVSPELNFVLLLGDRVGSRFLPDTVPSVALDLLMVLVRRAGRPHAQAMTGWKVLGPIQRRVKPAGF
jgi:hypothetical protein